MRAFKIVGNAWFGSQRVLGPRPALLARAWRKASQEGLSDTAGSPGRRCQRDLTTLLTLTGNAREQCGELSLGPTKQMLRGPTPPAV